MSAKAKINLREGLIELEGSEEFVTQQLDYFRDLMDTFEGSADDDDDSGSKASTAGQSTDTPAAGSNGTSNGTGSAPRKRGNSGPTKTKTVEAERFDYHGDETHVSLEHFLAEKKPGNVGEVIAVVGYYIQHVKGEDEFREGQVDFAYKTLKIKGRPGHLRQNIINYKNSNDWFIEVPDKAGSWRITRGCEIFVDEKLPKVAKK